MSNREQYHGDVSRLDRVSLRGYLAFHSSGHGPWGRAHIRVRGPTSSVTAGQHAEPSPPGRVSRLSASLKAQHGYPCQLRSAPTGGQSA